jgi:hypothetical protein
MWDQIELVIETRARHQGRTIFEPLQWSAERAKQLAN